MNARFRRMLCLSLLGIGICLSSGCARGLIKKGPTGEDGKGIGLKIPVLGFTRKESYDAENFSAGNLKEKELNPFQETKDSPPSPSTVSDSF